MTKKKAEKEYKEAYAAQLAWEKENHFRSIDAPCCGNCTHSQLEGFCEGEGYCEIIKSLKINNWSRLFSNGSVSKTDICDRWGEYKD